MRDPLTARALADAVARLHVVDVEVRHRTRDPRVRLTFPNDYRIEIHEVIEPRDSTHAGEKSFMVTYDFVKTHIPFPIWLGDGMEFAVFVRESDGKVDLVPGQ